MLFPYYVYQLLSAEELTHPVDIYYFQVDAVKRVLVSSPLQSTRMRDDLVVFFIRLYLDLLRFDAWILCMDYFTYRWV